MRKTVPNATRSVLLPALMLFALAETVYLATGRTIGSGDTLPARYLPIALLEDHTFYLDGFPFLYAGGIPYYLQRVHGHYLSAYPVGSALAAVPFYVPAVLRGEGRGSNRFEWLGELSAGAIVAASVALLFATCCRLTTPAGALVIAAIYAFGTSSLSVSSQGLWQHEHAPL